MNRRRKLFGDPGTPSDVLLRSLDVRAVKRDLARNPNLDVEALCLLAREYPREVLRNPAMRLALARGAAPWEAGEGRNAAPLLMGGAAMASQVEAPQAVIASVITTLLATRYTFHWLTARLVMTLLLNPRLPREQLDLLHDELPVGLLRMSIAYHRNVHHGQHLGGEHPHLASALEAAMRLGADQSRSEARTAQDLEFYTRLGWLTRDTLDGAMAHLPVAAAMGVAAHPDTAPEQRTKILDRLERDESVRSTYGLRTWNELHTFIPATPARMATAPLLIQDASPRLPTTMLRGFLRLPNPHARMLLATKREAPLWVLRSLARDGDVRVAHHARRTLQHLGARVRGRHA